jgi:F-type H+-transporting ATPase subunit delta
MSERRDALRWARELFDVTWRHDQADTVVQELEAIVSAQQANRGEARPLFHPLVPKASKLATVRAFSTRAGLSKPTTVLLGALVHHHALHLLGTIAEGFRARLNQKRGVIQARVTTASPLPPDRAQALATRLTEVAGRQVTIQATVDPSIIGGVVTQVESTVYDGSVKRQLARMRQKLVENV